MSKIGRPAASEAAPYYSVYIDRVVGDDILATIERQLDTAETFFSAISEDKSRYRYAPGKWSIREALNHVNDTERAFVFRALWFARGFTEPLPGFDQNIAAAGAAADAVDWAEHLQEFRAVRLATISLFRSMPNDAWPKRGIASGNPFTVRALAYITAGHVEHHVAITRERYL